MKAQTIGGYPGTDCTFNTYTDVMKGCTSLNYFTIQYGGFQYTTNIAAGWTLKVKANGNFSNGVSEIPCQYVSLQFNSANGGPGGVSGTGFKALSTTSEAALITTTSAIQPPPYYFEHRFDMQIQGGAHLLLTPGKYTTTLTFTLYDKSGVAIASNSNITASFTINYSNTCSGVALKAYSSKSMRFDTYQQQMAGSTVSEAASLQYTPNGSTCQGWTLTVKAAGDFSNGTDIIPIQYFSLRFNRVSNGGPSASEIGLSYTPVTLSNTEAILINQSNGAFQGYQSTEQQYDLIIQGGNQLLVSNGQYSATLIFTLYNQSGQVVSSATTTVSFQIQSNAKNYSAQLQNTADQVTLGFNSLNSYQNGVSVNKASGLKITGYTPYQVIVKSDSENLLNAAAGSSIPVSVVHLSATVATANVGGTGCYPITLSSVDQVLIRNPMNDYRYQNVEYNLKFFTEANDSRVFNVAAGVYTTNVIFVVLPQ